jgi:hypothetical protein
MSHTDESWSFADPPNTAVFTTRAISLGLEPICWVSHDKDDGAWQFHGGTVPPRAEDAAVVALRTIVGLDPSVAELCDLPEGWCASRAVVGEAWKRQPRG